MAYLYLHEYGNLSQATVSNVMLYANNVTDGFFGIGMLLSIFFITFIAMKVYSNEKSIVVSMLITAFSAVFLRLLGMISLSISWLTYILAALAIMYLWWATSKEN